MYWPQLWSCMPDKHLKIDTQIVNKPKKERIRDGKKDESLASRQHHVGIKEGKQTYETKKKRA